MVTIGLSNYFKGNNINTVTSNSIINLISSDDPLSDEAISFLIDYEEEDTLVDYKLSFDNSDREWLEISKDILAFTNTVGGYLVFGIKDGTYDKIGIDEEVLQITTNANNIIQKINRNIEPQIQLLRCKSFMIGEKDFSVIFLPPSLDKTHIINRNASFKFPSGKEKQVLYVGTTYVRRSAGNHMMDARDFDDIVNRRINHFRNSLLDKIARVVEAPHATEVIIVSDENKTGKEGKYIIEDAPNALAIKGMSFTVSPETTEQEIMGWIAMTNRDKEALPTQPITWKWYKERHELKLTNEQKIEVAKYSLLTGVPAFYWLVDCKASSIKTMLLETLTRQLDISSVGDIVSTGAFLGNRFHKNLIAKIGAYANRIAPIKKTIPSAGPRVFFGGENGRAIPKLITIELESELQQIAVSAENANNHIPILSSRWRSKVLDCYLYAQDDQYV